MPTNGPPSRIIELKACGPDDPDGSQSAAVLAAYFHAEHMKAFRQLLWRRLGLGALGWFLVGVTTDVLSRNALFVGLGLMVVVAAWAAVVEWRAGKRLHALLGANRST
jgi:hypothetical protein